MDETPANVVEELVRDGVEGQRERGVIPRTHDVKKYVAGIVERMERREAENRLRPQPKPEAREVTKERSSEDMESEYQKRLKRAGHEALPGTWSVERRPLKRGRVYATKAERKLKEWSRSANPFGSPSWSDKLDKYVAKMKDRRAALEMVREAVKEALLCQRMRKLWASPDWQQRLKVINPLATQGQLGPEKQKQAHQLLLGIIADSDRVFGPWMKVPSHKLVFGG